jgi:hypothetical protein
MDETNRNEAGRDLGGLTALVQNDIEMIAFSRSRAIVVSHDELLETVRLTLRTHLHKIQGSL